jgi:hypothetical protein
MITVFWKIKIQYRFDVLNTIVENYLKYVSSLVACP